jgi:hypothetical protein
MFVEGALWMVRTGSPWRDLPKAFGDWNSVFRRFSRWSIKGVWRVDLQGDVRDRVIDTAYARDVTCRASTVGLQHPFRSAPPRPLKPAAEHVDASEQKKRNQHRQDQGGHTCR